MKIIALLILSLHALRGCDWCTCDEKAGGMVGA